MSKEETPITAEAIIRQPKYDELKNLILICEAMDEFAQAKVLEALEREFGKLLKVIPDRKYTAQTDAKEYYETYVKPNYK